MAEPNTHGPTPPPPPPLPPPCASQSAAKRIGELENSELKELEAAPQFWRSKKRLSKQLSMGERRPRDIVWERRRRQILRQERRKQGLNDSDDLTDEDLSELKGCIELGFGFNEEDGQKLCNTLPALDLYFAVNRQYLTSPLSSPSSRSSSASASASASLHASSSSPTLTLGPRSSSFEGSPTTESDSWKICNPGDDPEQVKTKLRHWAQAVACSVMQSH